MLHRRLFAFIALAVLAGCHSENASQPVEGDAAEAAIRHLIQSLPELNPGVPKTYSVVLGEISRDGMMTPATPDFAKRLADLKLEFINAAELKTIEPDQIIVDNKNRLATFVLQLRVLRPLSPTTWEAETGWSYKRDFGRAKLRLEKKDGIISVVAAEKLSS